MLQVGVIPAGGEAFVLDADLERVVVLQQAQRRTPKDAEVRVGKSFSVHAFGHGGFTGTAMWIDPELEDFKRRRSRFLLYER